MTAVVAMAILVLTSAGGFVVTGYAIEAQRRGWPCGALLQADGGWLKIVAVLVWPFAAWKGWYLYGWPGAAGVLIGGFFAAFAATQLLGFRVQIPAVVCTLVGGVATLLLGAQIVG